MEGSVQAEGQLKFCLELKCFSTGPRASLNLHCNFAMRHDGVVVGWRRSTGVVQTASRCGCGDASSSAKCGGSYKERLVPRASPGRWRWRVRGQARGGAASARAGRRARAPCENGRCTRRVAAAGESCVGEGQRGAAGSGGDVERRREARAERRGGGGGGEGREGKRRGEGERRGECRTKAAGWAARAAQWGGASTGRVERDALKERVAQ